MGHRGSAFFFESVLMSEATVSNQILPHRSVGAFRFKRLSVIGPRGFLR